MTARSILATLALAVASLAWAAPAHALQPHTPVFTDASAPVAVDAGEEFFIALPSNPTTGYTWTQTTGNGYVIAYEGNVYQAPSNGMIGAGGQQIFIYHANRSGATVVAFTYARPFEPNAPPAKSLTFTVTVR
ncbi:MAG: protease inhibitor I42 family protein [Candidatus Eremiobacteraeota bacterium]|nr:protease inhibitor I42 family protein [Candidatus Eremiobacteraeota bacterium]